MRHFLNLNIEHKGENMKKLLLTCLMFVVSLFTFAANPDYHIGVVSGTVSQSEDKSSWS